MNHLPLTTEKLNEAAKRADKIGNDHQARVLRDMARNLIKWGGLTPGQERYCGSLLEQNSEEKLKEGENYYEKLFADTTLLGEAEAVCRYYLRQEYRSYRRTATAFLEHLGHADNISQPLPSVSDFLRLFENKYATKVRESVRRGYLYDAGQLVMIRKSSWGELEGDNLFSHYKLSENHINSPNAALWELPCMILDRDHRPISRALVYNEKRGGARWYRLLPLGHTQPFDVMERDLKKCQKKKVS